jgi:hypothetical protein
MSQLSNPWLLTDSSSDYNGEHRAFFDARLCLAEDAQRRNKRTSGVHRKK